MTTSFTPYERVALGEIAAWSTPWRTPVSAIVHGFQGRAARDAPEEHAMTSEIVAQTLAAVSAGASRTVLTGPLAAFARAGHMGVRAPSDIAKLDLWEADEVAATLEPKYTALGAIVGLAGGLGVPGLAFAGAASLFLAMRAVHEYATRYGFDVHDAKEQEFAVRVLVASLTPRTLPRHATRETIGEVVGAVSGVGSAAGTLGGVLGIAKKLLGKVVNSDLGTRLGKRVKSWSKPAAAVASAGAHAWFLRGVAKTAELAYRERFIARKYREVPELPASGDAAADVPFDVKVEGS